MVFSLTLALEQFLAFALKFSRAQFELSILTIELSAQFDEVGNLGFKGLDEFLGHGSYTDALVSLHYRVAPHVGQCFGRLLCRKTLYDSVQWRAKRRAFLIN